MTSNAAEKAVADMAQPVCYLPAMNPRLPYGPDAESVSMATSDAVRDVNIVCQKEAEHEPRVLKDTKVHVFCKKHFCWF